MKSIWNGVFVDVAHECYLRVARLRPGSEDAETAERAITMLLLGKRQAKDQQLLLNDVMRNARYSVRRSRARWEQAVDHVGYLAQQQITTAGASGSESTGTPEDAVLAKELLRCLHTEACRCGAHGPEVLAGLLNGNSTREIATASGVSSATINRTVKALRQTVVALGYREAA